MRLFAALRALGAITPVDDASDDRDGKPCQEHGVARPGQRDKRSADHHQRQTREQDDSHHADILPR